MLLGNLLPEASMDTGDQDWKKSPECNGLCSLLSPLDAPSRGLGAGFWKQQVCNGCLLDKLSQAKRLQLSMAQPFPASLSKIIIFSKGQCEKETLSIRGGWNVIASWRRNCPHRSNMHLGTQSLRPSCPWHTAIISLWSTVTPELFSGICVYGKSLLFMQLDLCLSLFDTKIIDTLCFAKN